MSPATDRADALPVMTLKARSTFASSASGSFWTILRMTDIGMVASTSPGALPFALAFFSRTALRTSAAVAPSLMAPSCFSCSAGESAASGIALDTATAPVSTAFTDAPWPI